MSEQSWVITPAELVSIGFRTWGGGVGVSVVSELLSFSIGGSGGGVEPLVLPVFRTVRVWLFEGRTG